MLGALIGKDLRRAWRNPLPLLINLALPLCITALIGLVFGDKPREKALGRVRLAIVDEDNSILTSALRSAVTRNDALKYLDPAFLDRETAMREINANRLAGVFIVPTNFSTTYFSGSNTGRLELIKNPAQSVHPAVLEEMFGVLVTGLNAVARNFPWHEPTGEVDHKKISAAVQEYADKLSGAKKYLFPPLIIYEKPDDATAPDQQVAQSRDGKATTTNAGLQPVAPTGSSVSPTGVIANPDATKPTAANAKNAPVASGTNGTEGRVEKAPVTAPKKKPGSTGGSNIFSYILVGMSAMFLLFIASNAMTDLQREVRFHTFERYHTLREHLLPFVLGKVLFAMVLVLICSAIMIGGGAWAFRIEWRNPAALAALTVSYAVFATGLMAMLVALMPGERRSSTLNDVVAMLLSMAGGCMFPVQLLPQFLREHVSPLLPSYWFVETARTLQSNANTTAWTAAWLKLAIVGAVLTLGASFLFRRRFKSGIRE